MRGRQSACCFTGHRPGKLPWRYNEEDLRCVSLKARIADAVEAAYQEGFRHFLCGMALGCDLYFCECVLRLRQMHPDVTVPGRRTSGGGMSGWWLPVTLRPWCPPATPLPVCSGGTGIWWTTPRC